MSPSAAAGLLDRVDEARRLVSTRLDRRRRGSMGQYLTPAPVAQFMASLFRARGRVLRALDAGAGVGSLTAALVAELCARRRRPAKLVVTAYELDPLLLERLRQTMRDCHRVCRSHGVELEAHVRAEDFLEVGSAMLAGTRSSTSKHERYDCAILNPPYRKIGAQSKERAALQRIGFETSNLYTAFLAISLKLLDERGELVAITPRSFCNGPYFRPFRRLLLDTAALSRLHVFEARDRAFAEDHVLQENVIFHAARAVDHRTVLITSSPGPGQTTCSRRVQRHQLVAPDDPEVFIRIASHEHDEEVARQMAALPCRLEDLGLCVSTGRVVDFRVRELLRRAPETGAAPLIYPAHCTSGLVEWPKLAGRKPNALVDDERTAELLIPSALHVLVKRFSAKEERRRIVAAIYDPSRIDAERVGFENHLNYYHANGAGLSRRIGLGLVAFLNSTLVDRFFRQFSGHTQVNATDLRSLRYPSLQALEALGTLVGEQLPDQEELDRLVEAQAESDASDRRMFHEDVLA